MDRQTVWSVLFTLTSAAGPCTGVLCVKRPKSYYWERVVNLYPHLILHYVLSIALKLTLPQTRKTKFHFSKITFQTGPVLLKKQSNKLSRMSR